MSWATGLMLWLIGGSVVMWIFGEIAARMGRQDRYDWLADRKRRLERRARRQQWGGR